MPRTLVLLWCAFLLVATPAFSAEAPSLEPLTIVTEKSGKVALEVEVARTDMERAYGLMERTSLAEKSGMLFLFPQEDKPRMWMKNTLIPLDMVFIGSDGKITQIHSDATPGSLEIIAAEKPVKAVLEINGGAAARWHLHKGDVVHHAAFE